MAEFETPTSTSLANIATARFESLFQADYEATASASARQLTGARVLLIGGAGSIGGAVARLLAQFETAALHILDVNENSLVELTRDIRSSGIKAKSRDIRWLPLDFGGPVTARALHEQSPYDFVWNFAAVKHVRSEKDSWSILRMLQVNVLMQHELLRLLRRKNPRTSYFSVSTDKAANPVNIMGGSKRLMEHVMFSQNLGLPGRTSSARFANVAFSDGSLLHGWLQRMSKRQPVAVPRNTRRYFVSLQEAGQLCFLAALHGLDRELYVPKLSQASDLRLLDEIATSFIRAHGMEAQVYTDENEAILRVESDSRRGRYPMLVTELDTSGEKSYEEFAGVAETISSSSFDAISSVSYIPLKNEVALENLIERVRAALSRVDHLISKEELISYVHEVLPEFTHAESIRTLDGRV